MAESQVEKRLREVEANLAAIDVTLKHLRGDVDKGEQVGRDTAKVVTDVQKELAEVRREVAEFRAEFIEQRKRIDKWDARLWAVIGGVLLLLLSSVVTLIITLSRKP